MTTLTIFYVSLVTLSQKEQGARSIRLVSLKVNNLTNIFFSWVGSNHQLVEMIVMDGVFSSPSSVLRFPHFSAKIPRSGGPRFLRPLDWKSLNDESRVDGTPSCGESALQVATGWHFHHQKWLPQLVKIRGTAITATKR